MIFFTENDLKKRKKIAYIMIIVFILTKTFIPEYSLVNFIVFILLTTQLSIVSAIKGIIKKVHQRTPIALAIIATVIAIIKFGFWLGDARLNSVVINLIWYWSAMTGIFLIAYRTVDCVGGLHKYDDLLYSNDKRNSCVKRHYLLKETAFASGSFDERNREIHSNAFLTIPNVIKENNKDRDFPKHLYSCESKHKSKVDDLPEGYLD